jgi:hypothetical protein
MMLKQNVYRLGVSIDGCRDRGNQRRQIAGISLPCWSTLPFRPLQGSTQDPLDKRPQAHPGRSCGIRDALLYVI